MKNQLSFSQINKHFSYEESWVLKLLFQEKTERWCSSLGDEAIAINFALKNGLAQLLFVHSASRSLSDSSQLELKSKYLSNLARTATFHSILNDIVKKLTDNGIKCMPLKGSFLSNSIYSDSALRPMSDIDILVTENRVEEAFLLLEPNPQALQKTDRFGHHLPPIRYRGAMIELHNSLLDINLKYQIPIDEVWHMAEKHPDKENFIMHPTHLLAHLILHIYYNFRIGGMRLGWFYDLKVASEYYKNEVSLDELMKFFTTHRLVKPATLILAYYQFLNPHSLYPVSINKSVRNQMKKIHRLTQRGSKQMELKYGYSVAWERIRYSKNWPQRLAFIKYLLTVDKSNHEEATNCRLSYLIKNIAVVLWQKIKFW